jgi:xylulokinase
MSLVGIDVGTSSVKAVAIADDGAVLARASAPLTVQTPRPGWTEQDPEAWWTATEEVLAQMPAPRAIGLSGQMHGLVALDAADAVIRPALLWNDQRTEHEVDEITERLGGLEGLVAAIGNRIYTGFTAPKLLWLQHHEPEAAARVARVLLPKDYVRLRLTGEHATEVTDASGTGWFDVAERRWSATVTDALELDPSVLPPVVESGARTGQTRDGVPVAAGAGDQAAGALGVDVLAPGAASVVLGTSGVVLAVLPELHADPAARVQLGCHAQPGTWSAMGVILAAAESLRWLHDQVAGAPGYDVLLAEAARWPAGSEGLTFLPYLFGERTPHLDPDARGAFVGLTHRHDRGAMTRAVLEGVAFALRQSLDAVTAGGLEVRYGVASGGGARSALWREIVASALEIPIRTVAIEEGAAYGAAMLGGVAAGVYADPAEAAAACVRPRDEIAPRDDWAAVYRERREDYAALYPALHPHAVRDTG